MQVGAIVLLKITTTHWAHVYDGINDEYLGGTSSYGSFVVDPRTMLQVSAWSGSKTRADVKLGLERRVDLRNSGA